jgi:hypothetical protein
MGEHHLQNKQTYSQGSLTFTLSPSHIIVRTSLQTFFLLPKQSYWQRRLNVVRAMIQLGEIRDLSDLAAFCGPGIEWRVTALSVDQLIYNRGKNEQAKV